jgi:hypothetical protein
MAGRGGEQRYRTNYCEGGLAVACEVYLSRQSRWGPAAPISELDCDGCTR